MTPLAKAQEILDDLIARAESESPERVLPAQRYAQIGTPVVACESLIVAVTTVTPETGDGADGGGGSVVCDAMQLGTFTVIYAHDCSWVANDDGTDDPERVAEASTRMDASGTFLWNYANELVPFLSKQWSVAWALVGGLGVTTLTLTIGID